MKDSIIPVFLMAFSIFGLIVLGVVYPYVDSESLSYTLIAILIMAPLFLALIWWIVAMIKSTPCKECGAKHVHTRKCS